MSFLQGELLDFKGALIFDKPIFKPKRLQPRDIAMEVRFLASGAMLTALDQDDFEGKTAREVKQTLAAHAGVSRFRQRLYVEDGFREIQDDEVFGSAPVQVQLVMLEFLPPDAEEDKQMISACIRNDSASLEQFLQGPWNPNLGGGYGSKLFTLAKW